MHLEVEGLRKQGVVRILSNVKQLMGWIFTVAGYLWIAWFGIQLFVILGLDCSYPLPRLGISLRIAFAGSSLMLDACAYLHRKPKENL